MGLTRIRLHLAIYFLLFPRKNAHGKNHAESFGIWEAQCAF
jgi:hypothetical protein